MVWIVVLLALLGAAAYAWLPDAFSARTDVSPVEAWAVRMLRHLAVPTGIRNRTNPVAASDAVIAEAREHFTDHCAVCHGKDGSGGTEMGGNFHPPVPDLRAAATQALSDGEIFYAIRNGVRFSGMPAWGDGGEEDDEHAWKLVRFVRALPQMGKAPARGGGETAGDSDHGAAKRDDAAHDGRSGPSHAHHHDGH